jgi:aminoglycoside phosphotransferase (APT) family kinase protein
MVESGAVRDGFAQVLDAIAPGSTLVHVASLRGGAQRRVFAMIYRDPGGSRRRVVVRLTPDLGAARSNAEREFKTLGILHDAGLPVPAPLYLDVDGESFGQPCIVMEFAGRAEVLPRKRERWLRGFAEALVEVHRLSPAEVDLSHLSHVTLEQQRQRVEQRLFEEDAGRLASDPLVHEVAAALDRAGQGVKAAEPHLVHNDYWVGNVLWRRGRVSAIIDWSEAVIGDPAADIAQFSFELALITDMEAARRFRELYAEYSGALPPNVRFAELFVGLAALAKYETWFLPGYRDLGLVVDGPTLEQRARRYLRAVVDST